MVRVASHSLRNKALLALEEVVQECRYRTPRRTALLRFALAYLWSLNPGDRSHFYRFWSALAEDDMWRFQYADTALGWIYKHVGVERDHELTQRLWQVAQATFSPRDKNGMLLPKPEVD